MSNTNKEHQQYQNMVNIAKQVDKHIDRGRDNVDISLSEKKLAVPGLLLIASIFFIIGLVHHNMDHPHNFEILFSIVFGCVALGISIISLIRFFHDKYTINKLIDIKSRINNKEYNDIYEIYDEYIKVMRSYYRIANMYENDYYISFLNEEKEKLLKRQLSYYNEQDYRKEDGGKESGKIEIEIKPKAGASSGEGALLQ